jgi:hypothetical protein
MKSVLFFSILILYASLLFGQNNKVVYPSIFEVQFSLSNYKDGQLFADPKNMSSGLGIVLTKGLNQRFEWRFRLNGSYVDSAIRKQESNGGKSLLVQGDLILRAQLKISQ